VAGTGQGKGTSKTEANRSLVYFECDRCGFSFRAGLLWIVDRRCVYFCRDCEKEINDAIAELGAGQQRAFVEAMVGRLRLGTRASQDGKLDALTVAALLGFHEGLRQSQNVLLGHAGLREGHDLD